MGNPTITEKIYLSNDLLLLIACATFYKRCEVKLLCLTENVFTTRTRPIDSNGGDINSVATNDTGVRAVKEDGRLFVNFF